MDQMSTYCCFCQTDPSPMMSLAPYLRPYPGSTALSHPFLLDNVKASPSVNLIRDGKSLGKGKLSLYTWIQSLLVIDYTDSPTTV